MKNYDVYLNEEETIPWDKLPETDSITLGRIEELTGKSWLPDILESKDCPKINLMTNGVIIGTPRDPRAQETLDLLEKLGCAELKLNPDVPKKTQDHAIHSLLEVGVKLTLHHTIREKSGVSRLKELWEKYEGVKHVVQPGRDINQNINVPWEELKSEILMYEIKTETLELPENLCIKKDKIIMTRNSFDLRPIKILL